MKPGIVDQHGQPPGEQGDWFCNPALRQLLEQRLQAFAASLTGFPEGPELRRAAVALAVADAGHGAALPGLPVHAGWSNAAALILTRRNATMRAHGGQWALPGGRFDHGETAEQTALRELAEEIDLHLDERAVLGRLDDYATRSGYLITPVVVWAGSAERLHVNPAEVDSIHRIELSEFLRADSPMLEPSRHGPDPVLRMPVGNSWIAAPTAALIYQFREVCLRGRQTRVAHFDQPDFAWR